MSSGHLLRKEAIRFCADFLAVTNFAEQRILGDRKFFVAVGADGGNSSVPDYYGCELCNAPSSGVLVLLQLESHHTVRIRDRVPDGSQPQGPREAIWRSATWMLNKG